MTRLLTTIFAVVLLTGCFTAQKAEMLRLETELRGYTEVDLNNIKREDAQKNAKIRNYELVAAIEVLDAQHKKNLQDIRLKYAPGTQEREDYLMKETANYVIRLRKTIANADAEKARLDGTGEKVDWVLKAKEAEGRMAEMRNMIDERARDRFIDEGGAVAAEALLEALVSTYSNEEGVNEDAIPTTANP